MMWTLDTALPFVCALERLLSPEFHVALGGSVLLRGESEHDLDVIVYPNKTFNYDLGVFRDRLAANGFALAAPRDRVVAKWREEGNLDDKWVEVWRFGNMRVDFIFPREP